ncbi:hypothetical protein [Flammeovirga kamogawensis]|uniref:Cadherin repeat domain-containing protein n=1 Tax=Flammeovirga kamogawensis TaxID=373891 RepID=A0ABX8GRI8_9BACT|nr:hypothetical protein [Flammeovirga kamogawensis]MBB6463690.1 hypothetical protein [Flammeovirga kamogawensis]QWG06190.1 hypothetical protein KM029_12655 [Flammeovirga kamogawensis]TRX68021.1 hypothetical protein EO216_07675 [Flammeovirga kamogawensis]
MRFLLLFFLLTINLSTAAFDIVSSADAFCIDNAPSEVFLFLNHEQEESFSSITGLENFGILAQVDVISPKSTRLTITVDKANLKEQLYTLTVFMEGDNNLITSNTLTIDVFGKINRKVLFDPDKDLIYSCDNVIINFKTQGDSVTKEVVRVYIDNKFYREQQLVLDESNNGILENLQLDRLEDDSLNIQIFVESTRDFSCTNSFLIEDEELQAIPPMLKAIIDPNYIVSQTIYGEVTFSSNSINSDVQYWEIYENDILLETLEGYNNEDITYIFTTSNLEKGAVNPYKKYKVILKALDASSSDISCPSNSATLDNIEVPYFPRVKLPTAVTLTSNSNGDNQFRLLVRDNIEITYCMVQIYSSSNQLVFESEDPEFIFGDNETLTSSLYTVLLTIEYGDNLKEAIQATFIVTP